ncbi:unnamed protein product [Ilex paraguariensis]|uniref:BAG family molecular chaperone regulator 4 n=1 Tax=Ilex paraguariensis TaxID=185542 RepID=A0ABC8S0S7_9AQUA
MEGSNSIGAVVQGGSTNENDGIEWEMRPGGMLVQKRDDGYDHGGGGHSIKIKVSHGSNQHDLTVPFQSTFGDLKRAISQETGLEPEEQKLLFRGMEKEDQEYLHLAGLKDNSKVLLMEDSVSKERKPEVVKARSELSRGDAAVAEVRSEVDKLSEQISALEAVVCDGTKVAEHDIIYITEMLMKQLLKLDSIEAEGEGKVQRKMEVSM